MPERLVIIPTYNERENIDDVLERVFSLSPEFHVLIVDDGSPDGTAEMVREQQKANAHRLFLLERSEKSGLGTAYIAGFKWALEHAYEFIFEMDADLSHDPDDLIRLYAALADEKNDMSIGSRYIAGGGVKDWPLLRQVLSRGASLYVQTVLWLGIKDPTAGFVGYRKKVLGSLDLDDVRSIGYAFQIEMKYRVNKKGFRIKEVPIVFKDRQKGKSKMSMNIFNEAVIGVLRLRSISS